MEKLEVAKPRKSVEVVNTISLVQRKAFNCLIMKSMLTPKPKGQKYHSISIQELCHLTGYRQKDFVYLDAQLREMQTTLIEWSDQSRKGRVGFLGHVEYDTATGMLEYSFHEKMLDLIRQKKLFNKLDVGSMRELTSKYSIALYEFCSGYRETATFKEGTGWRVLSDMKLLLCGDSEVYPQFKDFNKWVLRPAIQEVNEQTDIKVEMETHKKGRAIYAVRFLVKSNSDYEDILLEKPTSEISQKMELKEPKSSAEQVPEEDLLSELAKKEHRKFQTEALKETRKFLKKRNRRKPVEKAKENEPEKSDFERILVEKAEEKMRYLEQVKRAEEYLADYEKKHPNCTPRLDDTETLRPYNYVKNCWEDEI